MRLKSSSRRPGDESGQAGRRGARRGKGVVTQDDREVNLGLGGWLGWISASIRKGKVVKDLDRINPRRHGQDVGSGVFRQALLAEDIVRAIMGAIKEPVVAGEA